MKKWIALFVAALLCLSLLPVAFAADEDPAHAEGYTETGDGWTSAVTWMKNGDLNIFGKLISRQILMKARSILSSLCATGRTPRMPPMKRENGLWLWRSRAMSAMCLISAAAP